MKQPEINTFRPRMRVLSEEQAWAIHHAALQILEHTGIVMEHPQVQRMLLDAGCRMDREGRLLMPARLGVCISRLTLSMTKEILLP